MLPFDTEENGSPNGITFHGVLSSPQSNDKFCTKKTVYITDIEFQISYFYISTFRVVDFLIYKIEQYLLYYITQKPSGVQIGRLFCMDRREGGGEIITEIHPVKLRNFHEKEVGE